MKGADVTATRDRVVVTYTFAAGCQRGPGHPGPHVCRHRRAVVFGQAHSMAGWSCQLREVLHVWVKCASLSGFPLVPFFPGRLLSSAESTLVCAPSAAALRDGPWDPESQG